MPQPRHARSFDRRALVACLSLSVALASFAVHAQRRPRTPAAQGPFGSSRRDVGALQGDIYALAPNTPRLPDFSAMRPIGTVYAREIDIAPRHFTQGFPGVVDRNEWFGLRYFGKFRTSAGGAHRFRVLSDDGARLTIDGRVVIDNDGVHPPGWGEGTVELSAGEHMIVLEYFQGPRDEIALQLFWTVPGHAEAIFRVN